MEQKNPESQPATPMAPSGPSTPTGLTPAATATATANVASQAAAASLFAGAAANPAPIAAASLFGSPANTTTTSNTTGGFTFGETITSSSPLGNTGTATFGVPSAFSTPSAFGAPFAVGSAPTLGSSTTFGSTSTTFGSVPSLFAPAAPSKPEYQPAQVHEGNSTVTLFAISGQDQFKTKNFEEIRLAHYEKTNPNLPSSSVSEAAPTAVPSSARPLPGAGVGFSVGTSAPTQPATFGSGFGATTPAASGFGFGTTTSTTAAPAPSGFGFSVPPATTALPASSGFGATTSTPAASGVGFGTSASTTATPTSGFGFGTATAPASSGFGFGTTTTAAPPTSGGFGTTNAPAAPLSFGLKTIPITPPSPFGAAARPATATTTTGFSFGTAPATTPATSGVGFGTANSVFGSTFQVSGFDASDFMKQKHLSDIEVIAESEGKEKSFHLHKLILGNASKYFSQEMSSKSCIRLNLDSIIFSGLRPKTPNPHASPTKEGKDAEPQNLADFSFFLGLLYGKTWTVVTNTLPRNTDLEQLLVLYHLSAYFKASKLLQGLEDAMIWIAQPFSAKKLVFSEDQLSTPETCVGPSLKPAAPFPDEFSLFITSLAIPVVLTAITCKSRVILATYSQFFTSLDWLILNHQDFLKALDAERFVEVFSDDYLGIEDEYVVFDCATKWLEHNKNQDEAKIMATIRFPHISAARLCDIRGSGLLSTEQLLFCLEVQALHEKDPMGLSIQKPSAKENESRTKISLEVNPRLSQRSTEIDLVIICDNTGSMSGEIAAIKTTVVDIIVQIARRCKGGVRFALVSYRDYMDNYTTKSHDFISSPQKAIEIVESMAAAGGGDTPEALDEALHAITKLSFRKNALRYAILIGDAGPHGIGYSGDSYPNGSPSGLDWLEICDTLAKMEIVFFTCVPERSVNDQRFVLFMDTVAKKTHGKCIRLQEASKLPDVIVNSTIEDVELAQVVLKEIHGLEKEKAGLSNEEIVKEIQKKLEKTNFLQPQLNAFVLSHSNSENMVKAAKMTNETKQLFSFGSSTSAPSTAAFGSGASAFGSSSFGSVEEASIAKQVFFRKK